MKRPKKAAIDKILVSVLQRRFKSITEEMGLTLLRTTRSPILNEARDFVTGLYDAKVRMLEQTEYIPVLAFALQPVCSTWSSILETGSIPGMSSSITMSSPGAINWQTLPSSRPFFTRAILLPGQPARDTRPMSAEPFPEDIIPRQGRSGRRG